MSLYYLNVTVHVLTAVVWLGGMFFFALVGAPVLRSVEPDALRADLFRRIGTRFRLVGWIAVAVLLTTGVFNLHFRGLLEAEVLLAAGFWATPLGHALAWKVGAVAAMIVVQGVHDFVVGPAASRRDPGTPEAHALRRRAALLARFSAVLGIITVVAAVRLARGG